MTAGRCAACGSPTSAARMCGTRYADWAPRVQRRGDALAGPRPRAAHRARHGGRRRPPAAAAVRQSGLQNAPRAHKPPDQRAYAGSRPGAVSDAGTTARVPGYLNEKRRGRLGRLHVFRSRLSRGGGCRRHRLAVGRPGAAAGGAVLSRGRRPRRRGRTRLLQGGASRLRLSHEPGPGAPDTAPRAGARAPDTAPRWTTTALRRGIGTECTPGIPACTPATSSTTH